MVKSKLSFYLVMFITILTFGISILISFSTKTASFSNSDIDSSQEESTLIPDYFITIDYDIKTLTNQDVIATFKTNNKNIIVTNNDGKNTYIFKENGKFKFEYLNTLTNEKGSILAEVTWVDKEKPTAIIIYDIPDKTNSAVKAILVANEEITILNNDYQIEDEFGNIVNGNPFEHIFNENGEFTFEFIDKAGNMGQTTAKVEWIDKTLPIATITYDISSKTNLPVTAKIHFNKENITILNNDGKDHYTFKENGSFTFEYKDEAGNIASKTAEVNWIEKPKPTKKPNTSNTKEENNSEVDKKDKIFKMFSIDNLEYEIDSSLVKKDLYIKKNTLTLSTTLEKIFDKDNDYFEFYFTDKDNKKVNIKEDTDSVLTVMLSGTKKFLKAYYISENDKVQEIDYKIVNGNKLEIKNSQPGKYLVEYEKTTLNDNYIETNINDDDNIDNYNTIIITSSCIIGLAIIVIIIYAVVKSY